VQRRLGSVIDASDPSSISYIESLKSRIAALESRSSRHSNMQHEVTDDQESPNQPWNSNLSTSGTPRGPNTGTIDSPVVEPGSSNDLHHTMHEANYLSLSAMAEPTDRQPFSNQGLSFSTLFLAAASLGNTNPSSPIGTNTSLSGPMADFRNELFSQGSTLDGAQAAEAFKRFIKVAPTTFPVMTRSELEDLYSIVVTAERDTNIGMVMDESPEKILLVRVGIALGFLLSPNHSFAVVLISELTTTASQLMPRILSQSNDLAVVQCLTALAICSLHTTYCGSSWHLLGLTMTRCISAGMHTSRVSDVSSDSESKRQKGRAFWTLYILDTHLSTAMDRPFCLNDGNIMMSPPASPKPAGTDAEVIALRYLIQHAQLLRSIRSHTGEELLCHFVNLCHWRETLPRALSAGGLLKDQLHARGLVELLKCPSFAQDPGRDIMLGRIEEHFAGYATSIEHQLTSQELAPGALDGYLIFFIGVFTASQPPTQERQRCVLQCLSSLTILSMHYTAFKGFRNILVAMQSRPTSTESLKSLLSASEIAVSCHVRRLIFGSV